MYRGSSKQNWTIRLSKNTGLSMKKIQKSRCSIRRWHKKFIETWSVLDTVRSGRPRTFAENIESERQAFSRSPLKSLRNAVRELELPLTAVQQCTRFYAKGYNCMLRKCKCYRDFSQMTSQNKKSLQITCFNKFLMKNNFLRIKNFSLHPTLTLSS